MKAKDLTRDLEQLQAALVEHRDLYFQSLESDIPEYPVVNKKELEHQSRQLSRMTGRLRPFLERFRPGWLMREYGGGPAVDALEAATGMAYVAQIKGEALNIVIGAIDQVIGHLQRLEPDDEVTADSAAPIKSGAPPHRLILGYLDHLHPFIRQGCAQLFSDGYYPQAVEESAKAVFEYLRQKTGLREDGTALAERALSERASVLTFGDLSDLNVRNEQIGFMNLLKGLAQGVRNPLAHTHGKQEQAQKAFEYLVMASLLCRRIDEAQPPGAKPKP